MVRYKPVQLTRVWTVANTKHRGVETLSYMFEMGNGLCVSGLWLKGIVTPEKTPVTIVLNDQGRKAAASDVSDRVNRDEQVLALDLTFLGTPGKKTSHSPTPRSWTAKAIDRLDCKPPNSSQLLIGFEHARARRRYAWNREASARKQSGLWPRLFSRICCQK